MASKHAPLPWWAYKSSHNYWCIRDAESNCVARNLTQADAELICRAVNSHAALLEAARDCEAWLSVDTRRDWNELRDKLCAAIAQAEAK